MHRNVPFANWLGKIISFTCIIFFIHGSCYSQSRWTINGGFGSVNYWGDLQERKITAVGMRLNYTAGISYKISSHFASNLSFTWAQIGASDATNGPKWKYRNLSFRSNLFEAAITAEADMFNIIGPDDANLIDIEEKRFTPYIFAGVGVFHYNPFTYTQNGEKVYLHPLGTEGETTPYKLWQFNIPYGIGVKYAITNQFLISGEFNLRKTFTDYIDDVSHYHYLDTTELLATHGQQAASLSYRADEIAGTKYQFWGYRGNPTRKDGYYSFLIKISMFIFTHRQKFYYGY